MRTRSLVINVTLRCPLKCGHCCYSSDMFQGGHLSAEDAVAAISQAAQLSFFETVHFVGGDPLLHPDLLVEAMTHAKSLGLQCGITTSAFWAKSAAAAHDTLAKLQKAGLTEITLSYDDAHAEFVRLSFIKHAVAAARTLHLRLRVAVAVEPGCRITAESLRTDLGLDGDESVKIYPQLINSTGRADHGQDERDTRGRHADVYRGPCQSVLHTFQVDHEGGIRPCCGVLPHHEAMKIGHLRQGGLQEAVAKACADPLLKWISVFGPVNLLTDLTESDDQPLRAEDFDGICAACDRLFRSPELLARARQEAEMRRSVIDAFAAAFEPSPGDASVPLL
jgi:hypothetical protein